MPGSLPVATATLPADPRLKRLGFSAMVVLVSALALFFGEIATMALGVIWALQGFFSLGLIATAILAALVLPLALGACWYLACAAIAGERSIAGEGPTREPGPEA